MNLKQLIQDEEAVSPVIGVILMVAITVILAAVIGTFVLGLGEQVQTTAPQATFTFDFDDNDGSAEEVTITHDGGDEIERSNIRVTVGGTDAYDGSDGTSVFQNSFVAGSDFAAAQVSAGDALTIQDDTDGNTGGSEIEDGETVRITFVSANGETSATIGSADSTVGA